MSKDKYEYKIEEDMYLILLKYFNGEIIYLTEEKVKELKKSMFNGEPIPKIDETILRNLRSILKLKKKKPKEYAQFQWVYPQWSEETKIKKLKELFPEEEKE